MKKKIIYFILLLILTILVYPGAYCSYKTGIYSGMDCYYFVPLIMIPSEGIEMFLFMFFLDALAVIKIPLIIIFTFMINKRYSKKIFSHSKFLKKSPLGNLILILIIWLVLMGILFIINMLSAKFFPIVAFID